MRADLAAHGAAILASGETDKWSKYHDNPLRFFDEVLGFVPWSKQEEIAEAFCDGEFTTVVSANGVGKTKIAAALGLWFWRTRGPGCRVVLTSATAKHVTKALWKETRELYYGAKMPLGGTCARRADTGLRDDEGRELFGMTAETVESFQGIRARELAIIADESSGIDDDIFGAMLANLSGSGKLLLIGNGMRSTGYFAKTHHDPEVAPRYAKFQISALESPNVVAGKIVVQGLVTREWCDDRAREWGKASPWYKIRVEGKFVSLAEGALFSPELIEEAEKRWEATQAKGRLVIGLDPAGASGTGDESIFIPRRGLRALRIIAKRGLDEDAHVAMVLGIIAEERVDSDATDLPIVNVDRDGYVGAKVYAALLAASETRDGKKLFIVNGVRGGDRAIFKPQDIHMRRDEIYFGLVEWLRDGGAIPVDGKLEADLGAIRLDESIRGLAKIISKEDLRAELGRSPDRSDALALASVEAPSWQPVARAPQQNVFEANTRNLGRGGNFDPFRGEDAWRRR